MSQRTLNVLFLCTGNSARSVLADAYLNSVGAGRIRAYSAGSFPTGKVNPFALELLTRNGIDVQGLRSKSWDELAAPGAPHMDIIITVCDQAAGEACPVWPGRPMTAHWGVEDPAAATGDDEAKRAAFKKAFAVIQKRIMLLTSLPVETLDRVAVQERLRLIGNER